MTFGPGKYDDICTEVRERVGLDGERDGGVLLIVFGGNRGNGFACQSTLAGLARLPDLLEDIARQMRNDLTDKSGQHH